MAETTNIVNPGMAPGMSPGFEEDPASSTATLTAGTLLDYALLWDCPEQVYLAGALLPVKFQITRFDGMLLTLNQTNDLVALTVTLPEGTEGTATGLLVSSFAASASVDLGVLYQFAGAGSYVFEMTLQHDGQKIEAKKTLVVY